MRVEVVRGPLPTSVVGRWLDITSANPALSSPYFRPEFTQAVASCRPDVCVASVNDGEALLPFQSRSLGFSQPAGSPLSDYHGLVSEPGSMFDLPMVLDRCELRAWSFDHVPADQTCFLPWSVGTAESPVLDLTRDMPGLSKGAVAEYGRKRRKAERELGAIEFEIDSSDPQLLDWCIEQKSLHYKANNSPDIFRWGWPKKLLKVIAGSRNGTEFAGMLSVLRMGEQVVAAHFGLRSRHVLHWWFPTYDLRFHKYSPGIHLLREVVSAAPRLGISLIDFGKGELYFKQQFSNGAVPLIEGCVARQGWISAAYQQRARLRRLAHDRIATESNTLYRTARRAYWAVRF